MTSSGMRARARRAYQDAFSGGAGNDEQSGLTGALNEFRIHCPNCSHHFSLGEGLLMEENEQGGEAASEAADTAHDSLESLAMDGAPAVGNDVLLTMASGACSPAAEADAAAAAGDPATGGNGEDSKSSQPVSRCYQILNWTVEELEKVICDPNDRRIRKISSISLCDIEVRCEIAATKFGAPKNFCIIRAAQAVSIDQCLSLLKRQLLWVMKPRAQDPQADSPSPAR